MASYSAARAVHKTLTGTTVDTVTLASSADSVEVINRSGTDPLYVTVNGDVPTAAGDNTHIVLAGGFKEIPVPPTGSSIVVKVIGNGNAYTVEAVE